MVPERQTMADAKPRREITKGKFSKWLEPENLVLIQGWARDGLTNDQIAKNMHVSRTTLFAWTEKFPEIAAALKSGKEVADYVVENALYKSACGYYVDEEEEKLDETGRVVPTKKRRWISPSITAQIFWLKNRRPDKWRDKPAAASDQDNAGLQSFIKATNPTADDLQELYAGQEVEPDAE